MPCQRANLGLGPVGGYIFCLQSDESNEFLASVVDGAIEVSAFSIGWFCLPASFKKKIWEMSDDKFPFDKIVPNGFNLHINRD